MKPPPAPGSDEALLQGCRCPRMDNSRGLGRPTGTGERLYVIASDCPIHGVDGDAPSDVQGDEAGA